MESLTSSLVSDYTRPFKFFGLPPEIRVQVYKLLLVSEIPLDLAAGDCDSIGLHLDLFFVSRRMHNETYPVFYGCNTLQVFPIQDFSYDDMNMLAPLSPRYTAVVTALEVRFLLGSSPPPVWSSAIHFGLNRATALKNIRIFFEYDTPLDDDCKIRDDHYTSFCTCLVLVMLSEARWVREVEFDAVSGVSRTGIFLGGLIPLVKANTGKKVKYGPHSGWRD